MSPGSLDTSKMAKGRTSATSLINVMLVGKTGSGKSLLANTLLGLKEGEDGFSFEVAEGQGRGRQTTEPQSFSEEVTEELTLRVIDTPGFFDSEESVNARWLDILKAVSLAGNSLDVILLVVSIRQIGAGVDCFKIVKDHMLEYVMGRLVIVFTFAGGVADTERQRYTRKFNEEVGSGTLGASFVFSDQKDDEVALSESRSRVLRAIQRIHQSNANRLRKEPFGIHTEAVVRDGVAAMEHEGVITYRMYCEHMKVDEALLTNFISKATIEGILKEHNDKIRAVERHWNAFLADRRTFLTDIGSFVVILVLIFAYFIYKS